MIRRITVILIAAAFIGALFIGDAVAGQGRQQATKAKTVDTQTAKKTASGVCPFGNTPRSGQAKAAGQDRGFGPGNGKGNGAARPQDGTGYGAVKLGKGKANNPDCDGDGPKGSTQRKGRDG